MSKQQTRTDRWRRRPVAGLAVRALVLVVPFALSLAAILVLGRYVGRPGGPAVVLWYAGICGFSWALLWATHHWLTRLLPLAVLLEMALVFPDQAPSRTQLARRAGSNRELRRLLAAPHGRHEETVQQAAERVLALIGALARHDRKTRGHAERVRALTDLVAERMGLSETHRDRLRWAALLHDIGKLHIAHTLLNKSGKPNAHEWELLKQHPEHGARIVAPLMDWLDGWGDVVVQHHERWDGTGYPRGLAGTQITLGARIVAVADAYDVMTSNRAYKKPVGRAAALRELVDCGGTQFDPTVVRAMLAVSGRRLVAALGPLSWISGLPFVGQTTAAASTVAAQAGGALGAAALAGAVALTPVAPAPHPVPATDTDGAGTATVAHSVAEANSRPSSTPQHSPRPHQDRRAAHGRHQHGEHSVPVGPQGRQPGTGGHPSAKPTPAKHSTPRPTATSGSDDQGSDGNGSDGGGSDNSGSGSGVPGGGGSSGSGGGGNSGSSSPNP